MKKNKTKSVAIIPARGGSKRIPRKNIKDFLGKPVIAYPLEMAMACGLFDEVMVSTDDKEIASVARQYGAKVPFFRTKKNSDDFASTADVLVEVLKAYQNEGKHFEYACCIYPATPLLKAGKLREAFSLMKEKGWDTAFPVLRFNFPIQRALRVEKNQKAEMIYPEYLTTRSQDLEPAYHDSGQFYWFKIDRFLHSQSLLTKNSGVIILKESEAQDIDTPEDWQLAEMKFKLQASSEA